MVTNHEDILLRTLTGLEDDLDELRDMLMRQLQSFEGGLKQRVRDLPVWLSLPYARIKQLIRFPEDSSFHEALLGPRAVALAAGEIEQFVHTWVGHDGELADLTRISQSNLARPWGRDASLMTIYLDNLEHEAQAVMIAARNQLQLMRDEILAELEEQRRVDCEALEELVSRGDLEQGQQARKEIAELWEDQRRRADTFSRRWEGIERHIEQGLDITESGLDTLRDLIENAELGLAQAYPARVEAPEEREQEPTPTPLPQAERDALHVLAEAPADALDFDFDPYGEDKEEAKQALPPVASASPSSVGRKHINEDFFKSDEVNDDLIFANETQLDGPMIDFGDDPPEDQQASHQLFSSTLESSSTPSPSSSSPYEIFLSDDSDVSYQDHPVVAEPALTRPSRAPEHAPRPTIEEAPSITPTSPEATPEPPSADTEAAYPRLALAEQELDLASASEALVTQKPSVTLPYAPKLDLTHEDIDEPLHVDDASIPTAPMIEPVDTRTAPVLDEDVDETLPATAEELDSPTMPAGGWPDTEEVETLELARQDEHAPEDEEEDAEEPPSISPVEPEPEVEQEAETAPSQEVEQEDHAAEEDSTQDVDEFHWQAEALRRRQVKRPVSRLELGLAVGLPLAVVLALIAQSAMTSGQPGLLATQTWAKGLAFGACIWVLIGPMIFLQWKMGWRGARPVPYRVQAWRDEAELLIEHEVLEVGNERVQRDEIKETSLERWEDHEQGTSGLKLCLVPEHARPIVFSCEDAEDMPSPEGGHPLPRVDRPQFDAWQVSELTLSRLTSWAHHDA